MSAPLYNYVSCGRCAHAVVGVHAPCSNKVIDSYTLCGSSNGSGTIQQRPAARPVDCRRCLRIIENVRKSGETV